MKTKKQINEKLDELNNIIKKLQKNHKTCTISDLVAHTYTIDTLVWVLGEKEDLSIIGLLKRRLK